MVTEPTTTPPTYRSDAFSLNYSGTLRRLVFAALVALITFSNRAHAQDALDDFVKSSQTTADRVSRFLTGREQSNALKARELYQQADALFRSAAAQASQVARDGETQGAEKSQFAKAAKLFGRASEAESGSALSQDAMFMQAESLFFADKLNTATEIYQKLQKDYPRNRHSDRIASRLFTITQYWIDTEKAGGGSWMPINLFDGTRPSLDIDGHAIRVLDSIRYDDPNWATC